MLNFDFKNYPLKQRLYNLRNFLLWWLLFCVLSVAVVFILADIDHRGFLEAVEVCSLEDVDYYTRWGSSKLCPQK